MPSATDLAILLIKDVPAEQLRGALAALGEPWRRLTPLRVAVTGWVGVALPDETAPWLARVLAPSLGRTVVVFHPRPVPAISAVDGAGKRVDPVPAGERGSSATELGRLAAFCGPNANPAALVAAWQAADMAPADRVGLASEVLGIGRWNPEQLIGSSGLVFARTTRGAAEFPAAVTTRHWVAPHHDQPIALVVPAGPAAAAYADVCASSGVGEMVAMAYWGPSGAGFVATDGKSDVDVRWASGLSGKGRATLENVAGLRALFALEGKETELAQILVADSRAGVGLRRLLDLLGFVDVPLSSEQDELLAWARRRSGVVEYAGVPTSPHLPAVHAARALVTRRRRAASAGRPFALLCALGLLGGFGLLLAGQMVGYLVLGAALTSWLVYVAIRRWGAVAPAESVARQPIPNP